MIPSVFVLQQSCQTHPLEYFQTNVGGCFYNLVMVARYWHLWLFILCGYNLLSGCCLSSSPPPSFPAPFLVVLAVLDRLELTHLCLLSAEWLAPLHFSCFSFLLIWGLLLTCNLLGRLGWLAENPFGYTHLCLLSAEITSVCHHSGLFMWFLWIKLRSSCLHGRHSLYWTISPAYEFNQCFN